MDKPYVLVSNSKRKKPRVLGRYKTLVSAEQALAHCQKKNEKSREFQKKYPHAGIQDLFCDLEIIPPTPKRGCECQD